MWKYPTRYPFFFFHFVYFFPPPISFLSSFSFRISHSIDENNNSRFPRDLVILQMDAARNDTGGKTGLKSGGKEVGEITRNFISTDFRRKLLRNPRFINKLIIISTTHLHPTMMPPPSPLNHPENYRTDSRTTRIPL